MIRTIATCLAVMGVAFVAVAQDEAVAPDKADKERAVRILTGKEQRAQPPVAIYNDQAATDYCYSMRKVSDEEYDKMMELCLARLAENEFLEDALSHLSDEERGSLDRKTVQEVTMSASREKQRYGIMRKYCDDVRRMDAEAKARTMPKGRITAVEYHEFGSARPVTVDMSLVRKTKGKPVLTVGNPRSADCRKVKVPATIFDEIRRIVEEYKVFALRERNYKPGPFPTTEMLLGGPPSWTMSIKFSGGKTITVAGDAVQVDYGCEKIAGVLDEAFRNTSSKYPL